MGTIEVTTDIEWRVARDPERLTLVARCDALGLVARAVTFAELYKSAFSCSEHLLRCLHGEGVLDAFLRARGLDFEHRGRHTAPEATRYEVRLFARWDDALAR